MLLATTSFKKLHPEFKLIFVYLQDNSVYNTILFEQAKTIVKGLLF